MQNPLKNWDNVYTITYQVEAYFPFQWEACWLVGSMTDPGTLWNEKVARPAHHLQFLRLSHFTDWLGLYHNQLTGTIPTEMGNMSQLGKLLFTHCLNSLIDFAFYMIICIPLLWIYDLKMESVNWPKYLTTCKYCDFLISKGGLDL